MKHLPTTTLDDVQRELSNRPPARFRETQAAPIVRHYSLGHLQDLQTQDRLADEPRTFPGCSGPCVQGRKLCVTPDACQRAETSTSPANPQRMHSILLGVVVVVLALAGAWHAIARFIH